jgi:hypothetical protein
MSCGELGIQTLSNGVCFDHAFSKACQYITSNEKVNYGLQPMNIKVTQSSIQSCITWPKKLANER